VYFWAVPDDAEVAGCVPVAHVSPLWVAPHVEDAAGCGWTDGASARELCDPGVSADAPETSTADSAGAGSDDALALCGATVRSLKQ